MEQQPKPPRRESVSTTLVRDTCPSTSERSLKFTTLAVESFGRLGEESCKFVNELATHAAGGRWGIDGKERGLLGTTSSGHFRGYTGGHIEESSAEKYCGAEKKSRFLSCYWRLLGEGGEQDRVSSEYELDGDFFCR